MIEHYINDSSFSEWRKEMLAMETEGSRSPQTYQGQPLVNLGGVVLVTPETAEALASEAA